MASTDTSPDAFLDQIVSFPDGSRFERTKPITDLRKDPGEGRILYICRRVDSNDSHEYVMKIKAQWPGPQNLIHPGPSTHTTAELKALQQFRDHNTQGVPHLVTWKKAVQSADGIHPGGYIIYTIMTYLPGTTLWDLGYWSLTDAQRAEIQTAFLKRLRQIREEEAIAPYDCALRNVLWDAERKEVGLVDFEHYREVTGTVESEVVELERWGLKSRAVPGTWFVEWGVKAREAKELGIV